MSVPQSTMTPENNHRSRVPVPTVKPKIPAYNSSTMPRAKKELPLSLKRAPLGEIKPQNPPVQGHPQPKKLGRRSSKPILDWFQRKLGGTVRTRRASDVSHGRVGNSGRGASSRDKRRSGLIDGSRELTRVQSTPSRGRLSADRGVGRLGHAIPNSFPWRSAGLPVNINDATSALDDPEGRGDVSTYRSSYARDSMWSPTSNLEADEDASLRPLPPSSPPSPSPSSSSYLSSPRTFRSMTASTKPTTLLSVDLAGGMAHIAQAPPTPVTGPRISAHLWSGPTGGSISFSALPPSPSSSYTTSIRFDTPPVQAPQHTAHHPRNNPRPSSPPLDNASVLTLASSAFGIPGSRIGVLGSTNDATSFSHFSQFGGSRVGAEDRSSHLGDDLDVEVDRDFDASVRALRPRSSRRGSWESEASGWSARLGNGITAGSGLGASAAVKEKSLQSLSVKIGQMSVEVPPGNEDDESSLIYVHSNEEPLNPPTSSGDCAHQPSSPHGGSASSLSLPPTSSETEEDSVDQLPTPTPEPEPTTIEDDRDPPA